MCTFVPKPSLCLFDYLEHINFGKPTTNENVQANQKKCLSNILVVTPVILVFFKSM
jgi:hypothetical protein